jgi:exodeoxyribonuclease V gamma subunit
MPVDPAALQVQFAPRMEVLLASLLADLGQGSADPLVRECIVVQNRGMQRWLELQLSAGRGVWANPWFPFPEAFARGLWRRVAPPPTAAEAEEDPRAPDDVETLGWAVAAALPELLDAPAFAPLLAWLGPERDTGRLLGLSRRIARVLDRYLVDRPDILDLWESPAPSVLLPPDLVDLGLEDAAWQAQLWQALGQCSRPLIDGHPARLARRLIARLEALTTAVNPEDAQTVERLRQRLPRVSVFGLSALSGIYVRILGALARLVPVRVYTLAPSPADAEAFLDLVRCRRDGDWGPLGPVAPAAAALELLSPPTAHPLVRDQAAALRGFQTLVALSSAEFQVTVETDSAVLDGQASDGADGPSDLLHRLQADIAAGRPPSPDSLRAAKLRSGRDRSLGLHSCHGPLREAEVLRDQLLAAFDELPDLAPQDVVVMAPDLETYAPYLQAVFGVEEGRQGSIPFRIADRPARAGRPGIQAFAQGLRLLRGRLTAPEVLDLLALEPVRLARGVDVEGLDRLRGWVEGAGIRWGIDGAHRKQVGQPDLEGNTWRWGLTRMFLGWAASGDASSRLATGELLPYDPAGADPRLLGALAEIEDLLVRWREELLEARLTMAAWADHLGGFAAQLLGAGETDQEERLTIERTLGDLVQRADLAGFKAPLGLDAVTGLLAEALEEDPPPRGFLEGAITVCALQPMRAIPFRVVALMGMNDGAFPRSDRPAGFDLAARRPRLGAALRRDTDRLLFLEALVSARERLILTWTGQDARSEALAPPSVVVAELLDVLRDMCAQPGDDALVQRHPLQPFSPAYFGNGDARRWFSYAADYARVGGEERGGLPRSPLLIEPLPPRAQTEDPRILRLEHLTRCWENPARHFLQGRLGIRLADRAARLADREPLALDARLRWRVGDALVDALLQGTDVTEARRRVAAQGLLPLGTPGELAVAELLPVAASIAGLARQLRQGGPRVVALDLPLPAAGVRLTGSLDGLHATGRVEAGYGRLDARRELRLWLRHLTLCSLVQEGALDGVAARSWACGRDEGSAGEGGLLRLEPVPDARVRLEELVRLCLEGENAPLPFYPRAAHAYAKAMAVEGRWELPDGPAGTHLADGSGEALAAAAKAFGAGRDEDAAAAWTERRDLDDPYLALTLGDARPWDEDGDAMDEGWIRAFQHLAITVYAPLAAVAARAKGDTAEAWVEQRQP